MTFIIEGLITGIAAGFACGLLGVGGGFILVPAILQIFNLSIKQAVATSLFIIMFSATAALIKYTRHNRIELKIALIIIPAGIIGAQTGALLTSRLPDTAVKYLFIILVTVLGIRMLLHPATPAAGFISGLCGVGGGILITPLLYIFIKVPMHTCIGIALIATLFNSISGSVGYMLRGYTVFQVGLLVAIGSTIAAPLGVKLGHSTPKEKLRRIFAVILILAGFSILFR